MGVATGKDPKGADSAGMLCGGIADHRTTRLSGRVSDKTSLLTAASELAQYLAFALRTGGVDQAGPTLPAPVVEDVVSWVLRSRVTGQQFLRGVEQG